MIYDILNQSSLYQALSPRLEQAFTFLKRFNDSTEVGRHDIDGDAVYAQVQSCETPPAETRKYEVHRRYLDVQYVHRGREHLLWHPLSALSNETMPYSDEHDAALYAYEPGGVPLLMEPGRFTILYPSDGHVPGCSFEGPETVRKVVVKVRLD